MGQGNGSTYQTRDNSGTLFKNDRRQNENHPHAKGKALIGGQWYWVSAWTKPSRDGGKFQSLAFDLMAPEHAARQQGGGHPQGNNYGGGNRGGGGGQRPAPARQQQNRAPQDDSSFDDGDAPF